MFGFVKTKSLLPEKIHVRRPMNTNANIYTSFTNDIIFSLHRNGQGFRLVPSGGGERKGDIGKV